MPKTLLLADDSSTIQRVVELTFAEEDIRVIAVGDGEQAIQSIDREQPDIVLADIGMPRLDGYSVSSFVKQSARLQHIPVLLLAGAFEPIDEDRARAARCDGVLVKPFEPRLLAARVQELLDASHAQQAVAACAREDGPVARNGHEATSADGEPANAVRAWYRPELAAPTDRPAPPDFDTTDLDRRLAGLAPAPVASTAPSDSTPATVATVAPTPETVILDSGSFTPAPMIPAAATGAAQTMAPAAAPGSRVSLAVAFSALLAAEQSAPNAGGLPAGLSQSTLEDVVRRVLLNDGAMRKVVLETAERMVKEELERIKSSPEPPAAGGPGTE
jgi:CheY-like chemotaxis protein